MKINDILKEIDRLLDEKREDKRVYSAEDDEYFMGYCDGGVSVLLKLKRHIKREVKEND